MHMSRCADFVILNKVDQLTLEDQKDSLVEIVSALNPLAKVTPCLPFPNCGLGCCWVHLSPAEPVLDCFILCLNLNIHDVPAHQTNASCSEGRSLGY